MVATSPTISAAPEGQVTAAPEGQVAPKKVKASPSEQDRRFKRLDITMRRNHHQPDALIEVLHAAQEAFGYLDESVLSHVARGLKLPLSRVYGVATFYHLFTLKPSGAHTCVVCMGTACYVKGGGKVLEALQAELGVEVGETTADGSVSLMAARCLGACGIAPAAVYDGEIAGKQGPEDAIAKLHELQNAPE
jgi:bidirectional [NiFe] hydrogenase diaphorase subunit